MKISLQTVIAMINQAIGATGVVSQECKAVVEQYGPVIMDLLLAEVSTLILFVISIFESKLTDYIYFGVALTLGMSLCKSGAT